MKRFVLCLLLVGCGSTVPVRTSDDGHTVTIEQARSRVRLQIEGQPAPGQRAAIVTWVKDALRAVSDYYGRVPVEELEIDVTLRPGSGIDDGVTSVEDGLPTIRISIGQSVAASDFAADWVMTHEIVHTAFPELSREHHWLEEGLATYVEPIARARAGLEKDEDVWLQLVEGLPKGQPGRRDHGLDRTHTWGRTYWGGALYCLLVDVGIRERTSNQHGLRDGLRALVADDWTITREAAVETVLARVDAAVGVPVASESYAQHANAGVRVDLAGLWKRLGIVYDHGRVTFDDTAPEAALRRAITH